MSRSFSTLQQSVHPRIQICSYNFSAKNPVDGFPIHKYKFHSMAYNLASRSVVNSSINSTWELDENAECQSLSLTFYTRVCILTKFPGDYYVHWRLRSTNLQDRSFPTPNSLGFYLKISSLKLSCFSHVQPLGTLENTVFCVAFKPFQMVFSLPRMLFLIPELFSPYLLLIIFQVSVLSLLWNLSESFPRVEQLPLLCAPHTLHLGLPYHAMFHMIDYRWSPVFRLCSVCRILCTPNICVGG